ncbi:multidrug effflux MFS transporter [Acinetobacter gandensis]|uniref:Bcr/CflA family efflux transporter n=2 Tax=Acinetobacter gandensis TaxID=1443941 RepID=A0A1A7RA98_9GAMM|nr:multidrug effflux MFS transporter [Acinetobacter gandensis]OBX27637.1 Bcr/CflA family drug resistance efflux transporter [Acinetobacter gandensis]
MPILIALLATIGPIGIDMYLPSIPAMAASLGSNEGAIQLSLMTFFVGLMLGQLMYGPLSDKFGRKPLIYLGLSIYILGSIGCTFAQSVEQLQYIRFVQGLGGSIGMVIAFAIIKDQFQGPAMGKMMSMVLAILGLSPVAAPLIGDGLQALGSWRNIFIFLAVYAAIVLAAVAVLLPETRQVELRQQFKLTQTIKLYGQIITDRKFIIYALTLCIAQAGFFAYIAGSASVFISEYQLSSTQFSLLFALNAFGLIGAAILNPKIHEKFGPLNAYKIMNISFLLIMAVLILALCLGYSNLAIFCITLFIAVALLGFIMPTGSQLALMFQHKNAGTASALLGALQFGFGAIITTLTGTFSSFDGLGLVTIMFACALISALLCLITFPKQLPMSQH